MSATKKKQTKPGSWFFYVLECSDGSFYTGITNDLSRRTDRHNSGTASRYTRSRTPVKLIYKEACRNKSSALKKECRIKALSRKEKEEYITGRRVGQVSAAKRRKTRKET